MAPQTKELEKIVIDETWKRKGLIIAVADDTLPEFGTSNGHSNGGANPIQKLGARALGVIGNLVFYFSELNPKKATAEIKERYPHVVEQASEENLRYFSPHILPQVKFQFMLGVKEPKFVLDRNLTPYDLDTTLRQLAAPSDDKTLNVVYVLAHSDGRVLSNTSLSKFRVTREQTERIQGLRVYLDKLPQEQLYQPVAIAYRLSRISGVTILFVNSCSAGNLFDGFIPPRTLYIATSADNELSGSIFAENGFVKYIGKEYLASFMTSDSRRFELRGGMSSHVELPSNIVAYANEVARTLGLSVVFPTFSTLLTKGDINMVVNTPLTLIPR